MIDLYCYTESGETIEGPKILPKSWRNISGFRMSTPESLKVLGWLPYINAPPGYNKDTQYLTSEDVVGKDDVTKTYTVNDYTQEKMDIRIADAKMAKDAQISSDCQSTILEKYPYIPIQINVAHGIYDSEIGDSMKQYIVNMITACHGYETDIENAETLQGIRDITPDWPTK